MVQLSSHAISMMFLGLAVLLATARVLGEIAKKLSQPAVLGELLAGIILGPTVLGALLPTTADALFPAQGPGAIALQGISTVAVALFLFVAGMEVDLGTVWRQGRIAITVSLSGILIPFACGFPVAYFGASWLASTPGANHLVFALFFATALSISALPVIAKTLMDMNLFRTDLGMTVIAAAIFDDFAGWIIFAVILGLMGGQQHGMPVSLTVGLTLVFALFMLTAGRWLMHRALPWIQAHTSWPGGILGFTSVVTFLCASFTEWVGVHAVFGAFVSGVALGDSDHLRERTRATIDQFVSAVFAPIFFATIGLKVNFLAHFDLSVVLVVLAVACVGKVAGCAAGAYAVGMSRRESLALGFGMNARGAMEIILGMLALQFGLIGEKLFVALVVMAIVTSVMSGPLMQRLLQRKSSLLVREFLVEKAFSPALRVHSVNEAIDALARLAATLVNRPAEEIAAAAWQRECMMPTGIGHGVAVPHARLPGLRAPVVAAAIARDGVQFAGPDGKPAHLMFLVLTPEDDEGAQLELIANIAQTFHSDGMLKAVLQVQNFTELLALLRTGEGKGRRHAAA